MNSKKLSGAIVLVRGAGEQASGVGWALAKAGFRVVMTEIAKPLMVRWPVCFGTAVEEGIWRVEERTARLVFSPEECFRVWENGEIPVLVDPNVTCLPHLRPSVLVDAIMAKRNTGTYRVMAPLTIGLGPGFTAGDDVHVVIETNRGHNLGRIILNGSAEPNTGIPGNIAGYSRERVVYSTQAGVFQAKRNIGEKVSKEDLLGVIGNEPVVSPLSGVVRGLLRSGTKVEAHVKIGDIDPRDQVEYCFTISEKARAIGAAVVLAILENNKSGKRFFDPK